MPETNLVSGRRKVPVWRDLDLYHGISDPQVFIDEIHREKLDVDRSADILLHSAKLEVMPKLARVRLVLVTPKDLGFATRNATYDDVVKKAQTSLFSLWLCPDQIAPRLRVAYTNQPVGETIVVAMEPRLCVLGHGQNRVFELLHEAGCLPTLSTHAVSKKYFYRLDEKFVFMAQNPVPSPYDVH